MAWTKPHAASVRWRKPGKSLFSCLELIKHYPKHSKSQRSVWLDPHSPGYGASRDILAGGYQEVIDYL